MVAFLLGQRLRNLQLVGIERIKDQGSNSILKGFTRAKQEEMTVTSAVIENASELSSRVVTGRG